MRAAMHAPRRVRWSFGRQRLTPFRHRDLTEAPSPSSLPPPARARRFAMEAAELAASGARGPNRNTSLRPFDPRTPNQPATNPPQSGGEITHRNSIHATLECVPQRPGMMILLAPPGALLPELPPPPPPPGMMSPLREMPRFLVDAELFLGSGALAGAAGAATGVASASMAGCCAPLSIAAVSADSGACCPGSGVPALAAV